LKIELSNVKTTINDLNAELRKIKEENAAKSAEEENEGTSANADENS